MAQNLQRPVDLARQHGLSTQAVRNYEAAGILPVADRSPSGYRAYTHRHELALAAFLALVPGHGHPAATAIMQAVNRDAVEEALRLIDESHVQLLNDRRTLQSVETALRDLQQPPPAKSNATPGPRAESSTTAGPARAEDSAAIGPAQAKSSAIVGPAQAKSSAALAPLRTGNSAAVGPAPTKSNAALAPLRAESSGAAGLAPTKSNVGLGSSIAKSDELLGPPPLRSSETVPSQGGNAFVGPLAHQLGLRPATLRKWERAGLLRPRRDRQTGYRVYGPDDIRDARLVHQLRRGGYLLEQIAPLMTQVRAAGGIEPLAPMLRDWHARLTARSRAMLTGAAALDAYLTGHHCG